MAALEKKVEVIMECVKPEMVLKILWENDMHISLEDAEKILAFMVKLAKLTLNQNTQS
ncbi:MAG: hypothetical protein ABI813_00545 [Bacteroidota bacterium]